jgi:hypothetical protein
MENIKILFSGFIIGLFLSYGVKGCNNQKSSLKTIYDTKIDTLILRKDSLVYRYRESKKVVTKWDTVYQPGKDSICDSLVEAQRVALKNCDTLNNVSDTLIKTLLVRDTLRVETIKNINKRKLRLGGFGGPGFSNNGFGLTVGAGIVF